MVNDLVGLFDKGYQKHEEKIVLDNHRLDNGLYLKVDKAGQISDQQLVVDRKKDNLEILPPLYKWFQMRDYYSQLIDINKPVDPKKIHSNNYLSFFIKKDLFPVIGKNALTIEEYNEVVKRYFAAFLKKPKDKKTLEILEKLNFAEIASEELQQKRDFFIEKANSLIAVISATNFDKYIKVFFDKEESLYKKEYHRYVFPKIYNNNEFNILVNGEIYGLANDNMSLNAKKPFLKLKTTKFQVPLRITSSKALLTKKTFDWLKSLKENVVELDYKYDFQTEVQARADAQSRHYLYLTKGKEVTIEDYDNIPIAKRQIRFQLKNYLEITGDGEEKDLPLPPENFPGKSELAARFDELFFSNYLRRNYYSEAKNIKTKPGRFSARMLDLLLINRELLRDFFLKDIDKCKNTEVYEEDFVARMDKLTLELVKEQAKLVAGFYFKNVAKALNLRLSLLEYFKGSGKDMGSRISDFYEEIGFELKKEDFYTCQNDNQFYFLGGQIAYYLVSQSEAENKKCSLIEPFLRVATPIQLKEQLKNVFNSYKHKIPLKFLTFRNAFSAVMDYEGTSNLKDKQDFFLAGFMAKNLFYNK